MFYIKIAGFEFREETILKLRKFIENSLNMHCHIDEVSLALSEVRETLSGIKHVYLGRCQLINA